MSALFRLRRIFSVVAYFCLTGLAANAQFNQIETAPFPVQLESKISGLPVQEIEFSETIDVFYGPTNFDLIPDESGRRVITSYGGEIRIVDSEFQLLASPFLDLAESNEHLFIGRAAGLTALEFHPDFATPGADGFGKFYTVEPEVADAPGAIDFADAVVPGNHHHDVVYEYTIEDPSLDVFRGDKRELMRVQQPGWHHNFGDLKFGPDGMLYISSGDGNNAPTAIPGVRDLVDSDNSQVLSNVFGKILRIDPMGSNSQNGKYGVPLDNPFFDGAGDNVDEIYAYGLRNPYRLSFDPPTGALYASETGQLNSETINRIESGGNHGWNIKEGSLIYDKYDQEKIEFDEDGDNNGIGDLTEELGLVDPVFEYQRAEGRRAIIGGFVYRGNDMPQLRGMYLFADFVGQLFYGDPETGEITRLPIDPAGDTIPMRIFGFGEDVDGSAILFGTTTIDETSEGIYQKLSTLAGDFNHDQILDVTDINLLSAEIQRQTDSRWFDLNGDDAVDFNDVIMWVEDIVGTSFGDANLNGRFDSPDLIRVFSVNEFEDDIPNNSTWDEGDWNADGDFTTQDLIVAFARGNYLSASQPVPEPSRISWTAYAALLVFVIRRRSYSN